MTTGTPRFVGADADSDPSRAARIDAPRSRPVPGVPGGAAPTTAQVIRRTDASIARPVYAGLGVALHHFTEALDGSIDPLDLHRATTVLTKQVCRLLDEDDALDKIRGLVTDPRRVAMPDGTRATELCGGSWDEIHELADRRSAASCDGAEEFGLEAIVNLAAVRGVGAEQPWWGTAAWRDRVERTPVPPDDRMLLLERPELADDDLLSLALDDPEPAASSPTPRATSTEPTTARSAGQRREPTERGDAAAVRAVLTR